MRCSVCGQEYGLTHNCAGISPALTDEDLAAAAPQGFALFHYFWEAVRIARWEDAAIRRASRDPRALTYGVAFLLLEFAIIGVSETFQQPLAGRGVKWPYFLVGLILLAPVVLALEAVRVGLCHLLARWLCHGQGSYLGVLRPMLLGEIVTLFVVVPIIGPIVGGLWTVAILMLVFEEVEGITRLQAFGISFGVGLLFWIPKIALTGRI